MSYIAAADLANKASARAAHVVGVHEDPGLKPLGEAVALLAQAVEELARSLHREK